MPALSQLKPKPDLIKLLKPRLSSYHLAMIYSQIEEINSQRIACIVKDLSSWIQELIRIDDPQIQVKDNFSANIAKTLMKYKSQVEKTSPRQIYKTVKGKVENLSVENPEEKQITATALTDFVDNLIIELYRHIIDGIIFHYREAKNIKEQDICLAQLREIKDNALIEKILDFTLRALKENLDANHEVNLLTLLEINLQRAKQVDEKLLIDCLNYLKHRLLHLGDEFTHHSITKNFTVLAKFLSSQGLPNFHHSFTQVLEEIAPIRYKGKNMGAIYIRDMHLEG